MGVQIKWDNEIENVLYCEVTGKWTWEDAHNAANIAYSLVSISPHQHVNLIIDFRATRWAPHNGLQNLNKIRQSSLKYRLSSIIIIDNQIFRDLLVVYMQETSAFSLHTIFTTTLDNARQMIKQAKFPPSNAN